jgi:hypothetical protein
MQESRQAPEHRGAVQMGRMKIAFMVGEFVVPPMHRDPRKHRAPARHRPQDDQGATHAGAGRERAMREEAVIANRQAETGQQPHREKQADVDGADRPIKQQAESDQGADNGQDIEDNEMPPLQLVKVAVSDDSMIASGEQAIPEENQMEPVHNGTGGRNQCYSRCTA